MTRFTPQAWKIIKTRDTGGSPWLAFGIMKLERHHEARTAHHHNQRRVPFAVLPRDEKDEVADSLDPDK